MRKLLTTLFFTLLFLCTVSSAAEETNTDEVNVILKLHPNYLFTSSEYAEFSLSDEIKTYTTRVPVAASREVLGMTFNIDAYEDEKTFDFTPLTGVQNVIYNDKCYNLGDKIPVTFTEDETTIYMTYIPTEGLDTECYYNGILMDINSTIVDCTVMVPIEETAKILGLPVVEFDSEKSTYFLSDLVHDLNIYVNPDYVQFAPKFIDSVAYAPVSMVAWGLGLHLNVAQHDKGYQIFLKSTAKMDANAYVNNAGLASDTDHLIWVSKSGFTVHIFKGSQGNWQEICAFPCAIGAPYTPTPTGTYKFYQKVTAWDYGSYYVGPIMRFNGGYCLHSTLINKDGTDRDGRVGAMISHGCVRMKARHINWMYNTIPMYTTVHVTNY